MSRTLLWSFAASLLGVLLLQSAWALVVPPFTGLDEYGHAFKAAAVARGEWRPSTESATGGDGLVTVPRDLVTAARPVCASFAFSTNDHCSYRSTKDPGLVEVGSSASSYNPLFYAVVGTLARPFHGAGALYAMRFAASLLCAVLLAAGLAVGMSWSSSSLQAVGMYLTLTPVTVYSTMVVAPNGIELASAFLTWVALLGATRTDASDPRLVRYVQVAAVGAIPLALVRSLGPLWLGLIVLTCAVLASRAQLRVVLRSPAAWAAALPTMLATAFGVAWTASTGTASVTAAGSGSGSGHSAWPSVWGQLPKEYFLWFVQTLAAFPSRVDFAPLALYAALSIGLWLFVAAAWRFATRRERLALLGVWAVSSAIPVLFMVHTYASSGPLWQGRYGYPFAMGFLLICGAALDRAWAHRPHARTALVATLGLVGSTELIGLLHVLDHERATSPLSGSSQWPTPAAGVIVVLVVAAAGLLLAAGRPGRPSAAGVPAWRSEPAQVQAW